MSTQTVRLIRDGEEGERGYGGGGEREIIYLSLRCHHQNDFCFKMGSDESHFNVSLTVRDKATRQCPQITAFEQRGEPKRYRTEVLLLTSPICPHGPTIQPRSRSRDPPRPVTPGQRQSPMQFRFRFRDLL